MDKLQQLNLLRQSAAAVAQDAKTVAAAPGLNQGLMRSSSSGLEGEALKEYTHQLINKVFDQVTQLTHSNTTDGEIGLRDLLALLERVPGEYCSMQDKLSQMIQNRDGELQVSMQEWDAYWEAMNCQETRKALSPLSKGLRQYSHEYLPDLE